MGTCRYVARNYTETVNILVEYLIESYSVTVYSEIKNYQSFLIVYVRDFNYR